MNIALIKTSSLGDVIHCFPVLSDLRRVFPQARIDWVVEEAFAELPALHPAVSSVFSVALRRWRTQLLARSTRAEWQAFRAAFRARRYDLILDLQGLLKSAVLACQGRGPRAGCDWSSAREPLAALLYQRRYPVDQRQHAIRSLRQLASRALDFAIDQDAPQFGLSVPAATSLPTGAFVLLHMTARAEKEWPESQWRTLAERLDACGLTAILPWGSAAEQARAQRIAQDLSCVQAAPPLTLAQCAALLARARAVIGVDTGLSHLAAAYARPLVFLVPDTPRWPRYRAEPFWLSRRVVLGRAGVMPSTDEVWSSLAELGALD